MGVIISEEEYLAHYGRKGMKWHQHIYGDDKPKGTGRSRGSSSSSGQTNKKKNQTRTKSKYKSDEESDKAFEERVKYDPDHGPDNDQFSELIEEIRKKSGDITDGYSRSAVSEKYKKNRKDLENYKYNIKPTTEAYKDFVNIQKEYFKYIEKYDRSMFVNPYTSKEGIELRKKLEQASSRLTKESKEIEDRYDEELYGIVLEDLGYRNTKKSRKRLQDIMGWYD